ncbi:CRISPR-associated protein Cas5d [Deinobacterium chartae]|uniref:pre-crRNA processing endonuclease n=1 Tax=Deinobacterium chartae TaxID=521158 RepID=A0A841HXC6_9DEIO|nr:type I-C CRISPR-associated protein Cas5c [Deinobacterium chartae]MBB6096612.1 CRISPR-associated protein Cas5d [Deinobacterium chartae]
MTPVRVKVWGDLACFTRPEFGAERVTYDVPTPSAARGVLEAIFFKPEMAYHIRTIQVLKPIRHLSIRRNEINNWQSESTARSWQKSGEGGYYADDPKNRAQRHTLMLRDVAYIIEADIVTRSHAGADVAKYRDQFRRRVRRGQAFYQPYLGTRECSAYFEEPDGSERPLEDLNADLGLMLFDLSFTPRRKGNLRYLRHDTYGAHVEEGDAQPVFFRARLEGGTLVVPQDLYRGPL